MMMTLMIVVMMVSTAAAALSIMMMVLMLMFFMIVVVMLMIMLSLLLQLCHQLCFQIGCTLDGCKNVLAIQFIPGSGNDGRLGIMLTNELHSLFQLVLRNITGSAQDNGSGMLNLIDKELPKILNIHLALRSIYNCYRTV